ncbi:MAG: transcription-repair coupling factor [Phycisphaerae bacterium]|nr:transcription-repair coupling factor [Phycisphaerae bacterium]MCZ2400533.1 transcription-repair coupling factor [Phycisphaerae bacterium]NUQ48876.1 transcription-repair coupling factor [Phycisphaerae bacterium]
MDPFAALRSDARIGQLADLLKSRPGLAVAEGLWGSSAPIVAAIAAERLRRPMLLVVAHLDEADDCRDDIETVIGRAPDLLPPLESVSADATADEELVAERLRLCLGLLERAADPPQIIVAPIHALMQPVPAPQALRDASRLVQRGDRLVPGELERWLDARGFVRCDQVELPGDFARRGGIIDVFGPAHSDPVRIEFFGDEVESIRLFDAGTQRSAAMLESVRLAGRRRAGPEEESDEETEERTDHAPERRPALSPARSSASRRSATRPGDATATDTTSFLALLAPDTIIAFNEPGEIQEIGRTFWQRLGERAGIVPADAIFRRAADFSQLLLQRFSGGVGETVSFGVGGLPQFEPKSSDALRALAELAGESDVVVLCDNRAEEQRFRELLEERHGSNGSGNGDQGAERSEHDGSAQRLDEHGHAALRWVRTAVGVIHRGFVWQAEAASGCGPADPSFTESPRHPITRPPRIAFVPHHELFSRYRQRRTLRRVSPARPIDSFFDLSTGDYVVHALHGIGRFTGLKALEKSGRRDEYLAIEFADSATVHVPVSQIHVVGKYIGSVRGKPALSKLGGTAWKRTKERVADSVTDLAAEMLAIQAQRATQAGVAFPQDTTWQREFEESFLYTETPDQLRALDEIKADMTRPRPMDRLVCGDVGFGKTELAIRAAFKTVEYGRQVGVLVPTTVLAEQHFSTFRERLADYPFTVEVISRFRSKREQGRIVERVRKGQVDILIGTHRLLSSDVRFADLGLVIIDEEQRFGVEAKERLKRLRATVDVLTLSATPIPRTLHMSLLGIRDISSLATPPVDRRAIVTQVRMWDDRVIREAVLRELNRDGQVYFVHNFVKDIHGVANHLRSLVPEARVVVGHGQMGGAELEEVMLTFMRREADILVATNIIESGIDIPSANTIFINRAERFGLADLHQLRGRVGRSKHRAYCYLLLSPKHPLKDVAARRLKAIEHYSDLGAGFQIAMRDLEIRGAGNILGAEQSGNIEAVGYEMYCQLLEQAVRKLRNEPAEIWRPVNLELGVSASIPRGYIRADRQRMEVYKRLASCRGPDDVSTLRSDLLDAFGPLPDDVQTLLTLAEIRVLAQPWGVRSIVLEPPDLIFAIDDLQRVQPLFSDGPGSPRVPDPKTIHWRLPRRLLEPERLLETLRAQLARAPRPALAPA